EVAERLEVRRVLIPRYPGVMCALGLLVADVVRDYSQPVLALWDDLQNLPELVEGLRKQALQDLAQENVQTIEFVISLDMRYIGQSYELDVLVEMAGDFHTLHQNIYG